MADFALEQHVKNGKLDQSTLDDYRRRREAWL
jgi:hypothetical protein